MNKLIVFVGGGSGGHLTPMIPVAEEVKKRDATVHIVHIGQKGDRLNSIVTDSSAIDSQYTVSAGKFRRYHGESWLVRLFDLKTFFFNVRDLFRFSVGIIEAWRLLGKLKPTVIFMKGGYVCAPVGIAAGWRGIPYVTHDSDAMVSLAHRIIANKAAAHLTAMDPQLYLPHYSSEKTRQVGVPVRSEYTLITPEIRAAARQKLQFTSDDKVLLVVGGGLGARNINNAILRGISGLLADAINTIIITGHKSYKEATDALTKLRLQANEQEMVQAIPFTDELQIYSAAADVIVTRAGATNIAEFAAQGAACIVVPNPLLTGGHQSKNAQALVAAHAVEIVEEKKIDNLTHAIRELFADKEKQDVLRQHLHAVASDNAAGKISDELFKAAGWTE